VALNFDFIKEPEKLELPGAAAMSAGWFWNLRRLNQHADSNNFERITKLINGGLNGYDDRLKKWAICKNALGVKETDYE
jgi:putative chitinase